VRSFLSTMLIVCLILVALPDKAPAGQISGTVKAKGLRSQENILVYLSNASPELVDLSDTRFVMDQKNLTFFPHVLPIPVGATIHFPNNDQVAHNVFSLSRTKPFNLGSYTPGEIKTVQFDTPGIVELRCDVHAEMAAYIMVMKTPYFSLTDANGRFEIPDKAYLKQNGITDTRDLPAGKYFVKTRHEKLKTKKQAVIIPEDGVVSVQLDLGRGNPSVLYK
jgi:plastocyanin